MPRGEVKTRPIDTAEAEIKHNAFPNAPNFELTMKEIISTVCLPCGRKNNKKPNKGAFGMWLGDCDMCGATTIPVADAAHDFGIYSTKEIEERDRLNDF